MSDAAAAPGPRRAALAFIFMTVVLDVLALGVIIPVLPNLVKGFLGGDTQGAAKVIGFFGTTWALMQFIFSPLLGVLSDRVGRRPIILISCFGLGFDYFVMALAPNLTWLFIGRVISGIMAASFATAGAYIADVTPPEKRASSYGILGAAWGLGFVLGPALGGVLGHVSPRLPFWVSGGLTLLNALYGLFVLPESLAPERRAPFRWSRANPVGSLNLLRSHPELLGLAGVYSLYQLAHQVLPSVFVLYVGYRYNWGPHMVGAMLATVGICNIIVQAGLVRPAVARFGERRAMFVGLLSGCAGFAFYGLARSGVEFWCIVPLFAFMGFYGPASQGLMTRRVGVSEQGQLQGANSSLAGIAGMVGPELFTQTFARFIGHNGRELPGAPFFLASGMMALAFVIAAWVTRPRPAPTA